MLGQGIGALDLPLEVIEIKSDEGLMYSRAKGNISEDSSGKLWIASGEGVYLFDGYNAMNFSDFINAKYPELLLPKHIFKVQVGPNNNVWIATKNGLYFYDQQKVKCERVFLDTAFYEENYRNIIRLISFTKNEAYVGTENGLYIVDIRSKKVVDKYLTEGEKPNVADRRGNNYHTHNVIWATYPMLNKDTLWVQTTSGMNVIDKRTKRSFLVKNGTFAKDRHWFFQGVVEGNNIIMPTYIQGLQYYDFKKNKFTKQFAPKPLLKKHWATNAFKSLVKVNDSTLFFLTEKYEIGSFNVNTQEFKLTPAISLVPVELYFDSHGYLLSMAKNNIYLSEKPYLKTKQKKHNLSIYSVRGDASFLSHPSLENLESVKIPEASKKIKVNLGLTFSYYLKNVSFRYRLNHGKWSQRFTENSFYVEQFYQSNYELEVEVYSNEELVDSVQCNLEWLIPFYRKIWFQILAIVLIVLLLLAWYYSRIKKIKFQQSEKLDYEKRIAQLEMVALKSQMSPHFIFNSVNSIKGMIVNNETENAALQLSKFSKFMRNILNYSGGETITLHKEIAFLKQYAHLENFKRRHTVNLSITGVEDSDLNDVEIMPFIIQPFVENAFKHAFNHMGDGGQIDIILDVQRDWVFVNIKDNGIGEEQRTIDEHISKGISLVEKRLELYNGTRDNVNIIFNGKNLGTRVFLKIKNEESF
jgi:hypothetical protein